MTLQASNLGFPRIGAQRELKKALEAYWSGETSERELQSVGSRIRAKNWATQRDAGIDFVPSNDFSLYDHVLDMAVMVGAIPGRFQSITDPLKRYFAMARGHQDASAKVDITALEMTKWFDTNYHYMVPELEADQEFELDSGKILGEIREARALGIETRPVVIGPVSFLLLSKLADSRFPFASTIGLLDKLLPVYEKLFAALSEQGVEWVQLDEPCLALDLGAQSVSAFQKSFAAIKNWRKRPKVFLATYFGPLKENLALAVESGCDALHVDVTRAHLELPDVLAALPQNASISLGVIDGRNIWRTDLDAAFGMVQSAVSAVGPDRVLLAPSCSFLHVPVDAQNEKKLDPEIKNWIAFAVQKLSELKALALTALEPSPRGALIEANRAALASRAASPGLNNPRVRERCSGLTPEMHSRGAGFEQRAKLQGERLGLPLFPTTTIGSFPQTDAVRGARADWRKGLIDDSGYDEFLKEETRLCIAKQEELGIDVLVHGEFERNDMVEYFGEKLSGFAFTSNGWVQSYGSRYVKPPIIYGDVERPRPMTVEWSRYAQSLTKKPVKGMLTGPVTILQWSFVRDDQSRSDTCVQIAFALRDEVCDLEKAGLPVIQVDEPAIREGLPLRHAEWENYLRWAVGCFRLATSGVRPETQIHTHMCYSEFGDILQAVADMDSDVLSIETSRSRMELLEDFSAFRYPNEIGPGVYDIHSPRIPTKDEIVALLERARSVVPERRLWVNPDCGLKTRSWRDVEPALRNMVEAAKSLRAQSVPEA